MPDLPGGAGLGGVLPALPERSRIAGGGGRIVSPPSPALPATARIGPSAGRDPPRSPMPSAAPGQALAAAAGGLRPARRRLGRGDEPGSPPAAGRLKAGRGQGRRPSPVFKGLGKRGFDPEFRRAGPPLPRGPAADPRSIRAGRPLWTLFFETEIQAPLRRASFGTSERSCRSRRRPWPPGFSVPLTTARRGWGSLGFDNDPEKVEALQAGQSHNGHNNAERVALSDRFPGKRVGRSEPPATWDSSRRFPGKRRSSPRVRPGSPPAFPRETAQGDRGLAPAQDRRRSISKPLRELDRVSPGNTQGEP